MDHAGVGSFLGEVAGLCVRTRESKVLYQNKICTRLCGRRGTAICRDGSMKLFRSNGAYPALTEGIHFFPGVAVQKQVVDLVILSSDDNLTTLLYPLGRKQKREAGYFEAAGLTKREAQVAALASQGKTNQQIAKMLYISKATLKTHICHIYKKMPHLKEIGFRRSGFRGN